MALCATSNRVWIACGCDDSCYGISSSGPFLLYCSWPLLREAFANFFFFRHVFAFLLFD